MRFAALLAALALPVLLATPADAAPRRDRAARTTTATYKPTPTKPGVHRTRIAAPRPAPHHRAALTRGS